MATFRVGVGSFNIQDGAVGFGTDTDGLGNLKVKGVTKTTGSIVSGASTLTRYSGFAADNINQLENITLTSEVGTIGDIVVGVGTSVIISSGSTVTVGTVESVSIGTHFSPPVGGIEDRGEDFIEGMMRFNTDLNTMEFYNGNEWRQFTYVSDVQNSPSSRGRVVLAGGYTDVSPYPALGTTDFLNISTLGNSQNFGDLVLSAKYSQSGCSDGIRGLFQGGQNVTDIEYITIASEGDSIDFGNLTSNGNHNGSLASSTRGIRGGGYSGPSALNTIDYVQIQTLGNSLDFGDLLEINYGLAGMASPTRGIFAGGRGTDTPLGQTTINQITISSTGNAVNFGNMSARHSYVGAFSNSIRGFVIGGQNPRTNTIQFLTIASSGSMKDFGDLSQDKEGVTSGSSNNHVRGLVCAGQDASGAINQCDFITIATTGNATDFGDSVKRAYGGALSDSHGGLGGY